MAPEPEPVEHPPALNPLVQPPGDPVVGEAGPEPEPVVEDDRTRLDATPAPEAEPAPEPEPEPAEPEPEPDPAPVTRSWLDEPEPDQPAPPRQRPTAPPGASWLDQPGEITAERRPTAAAGRSWLDEPPSAAADSDAPEPGSWLDEPSAGGNGAAFAGESPQPEPEDPDPPHGDPLTEPHRAPAPQDDPQPAPEDPDAPHGDPLRTLRALDLPAPATDPDGRRDLRTDLPPLPPASAPRQPPRAPRPRRGSGAPPNRSPGAPTQAKRRRRWRARFGALVAILAVIAAIVFIFEVFQPFHGAGHGRVAVTIPRGASATDIGNLLAAKGVVAHGNLFALRAMIAGKRGRFQAGGFVLKRDMSYEDAINVLVGKPGAAATINVTIPEGRGRRESAPLLAQAGVTGDYLAASKSSPQLDPRAYGAPRNTPSLEGFLWPSTYQLKRGGATAKQLVADQLASFKTNFAKVDLRAARAKNLSRYDVITIASMIDREAQVPRDRRLVSAVIYNRLQKNMSLGIDATTRYALNDWDKPLSNADFTRSGAFNTRSHTGLPPTPIGNPGLAALQAAANPAHAPYLFYVIKPCGHGAHAFSSTPAQFQRDVAAYNAARQRLGRSPVTC